jgi:hypothetical protein
LLGIDRRKLKELETPAETGKKSRRGCQRTFSKEQIQFVVRVWQTYTAARKKIKKTAFFKHLKRSWKKQTSWLINCPARKTVEDMLRGNGFGKIKSRPPAKYYPPVTRFYPNAQVLLDGKDVIISLLNQAYQFVVEFCQDIATSNIGGNAISHTETAEVVVQASDQHCATFGKPLAALVDNSSGNGKATLSLGAQGMLVIRAHPYRPETKGLIEGEFGIFEKKVSTIVIAGTTPQEMALSIITQISSIYLRLRNQTPRCSVCPFKPHAMMNYQPTAEQKQQAYDWLKAMSERQQLQQEQRLKVSREFQDLVDSIIKEQRLTGNRLTLKQNLKHCSLSSLRDAELRFVTQSKRDTFIETKRTMAYFAAIARRVQQEKDQAEKECAARRRYHLDLEAKQQRTEIQAQSAEKVQAKVYQLHPEHEIVAILKAEMFLPPSFREKVRLHKNRLQAAVETLITSKTRPQLRAVIEKTEQELMRLDEFSLEVRYEMVALFKEKINAVIQKSG